MADARATRKPSIPNVPRGLGKDVERFLLAVKEHAEVTAGQRGDTTDRAVSHREFDSLVAEAVKKAVSAVASTPIIAEQIRKAVAASIAESLNTAALLKLLESAITEDQLDDDLQERLDMTASDGSSGTGTPTTGNLPTGGTVDQALRKLSSADYDASWADVHEIPSGGTANQALRKDTGTDYDVSWQDVHEIPAGGTAGYVLTKTTGTDYDVDWAAPTGYREMWVDAGEMHGRTTGGAASATVELTTNKVNFDCFDFDQTTVEYVQFKWSPPENWDLGTIKAKFFWTAASGSGDVVWALQAVAVSDDDAMDVAFGSAQAVTDTLLAVDDCHVTAATAAITVGGTPATGDLVYFQVYRDAAAGGDTLAVDARLLGVKIQYQEATTVSAAW